MFFSERKSFKNYLWEISEYDERKILTIYQKFGFSEILSKLLSIKNLELSEIENFINPTIRNSLTNPLDLLDMEKGVNIVYESILNKEKICIFGDYDVDGVSSSALMKNYFDLIKVNSIIYIPDRILEGYGPNKEAFFNLKTKENVNLILTVDCGISAFEACDTASQIGLKIVITDHHLGNTTMPKANAIINPNRLDETSEYKNLAGVGVAFLFLVALNTKLRDNNFFKDFSLTEPNLISFLDLVALGTICDVVPLVGLNRAFVRQGLKVIRSRSNLGIKSLIDISEINEEVSTYHIGFILGPRINATGRIGESNLSSQLLWVKDNFETQRIAKNLNLYNTERQIIEKNILEEALLQVEKQKLYENDIIFVEGNEWHEGVIGIIASRIKDKFEKPTIVLSKLKKHYKASCRSLNFVDIGSAIIEAKLNNLILDGGGHAMAGGFTIEHHKLDELKQFFFHKLSDSVQKYLDNKKKKVDLILTCSSLNLNLAHEIEKLGPFGSGNHKPKIILKDIIILKADLIGKNQTNLRLIISDDNTINFSKSISAIYFRTSKEDPIYEILSKKGQKINLLGELNINRWKGEENIQFIIEDFLL